MTADEKLAKLRARYPDWRIDVTDLYESSALCIGTMSPQRWAASATWYALGPNGSLEQTEIVRKCKTQDAALDALADALAKLESKCPKCGGQMVCALCSVPKAVGVTTDAAPGDKLAGPRARSLKGVRRCPSK